MNPVAATALSGMMASMARLSASAAKVADGETEGPAPGVDLVAEEIEQITAGTEFKANLTVLKTADEMEQTLLDLRV
jgi:flagellar hook protein FlgE